MLYWIGQYVIPHWIKMPNAWLQPKREGEKEDLFISYSLGFMIKWRQNISTADEMILVEHHDKQNKLLITITRFTATLAHSLINVKIKDVSIKWWHTSFVRSLVTGQKHYDLEKSFVSLYVFTMPLSFPRTSTYYTLYCFSYWRKRKKLLCELPILGDYCK